MKGDMGGSASVISAIEAIANLNLDINIEALCLATENMPSGSAQRPSDVVKAMDGTYIEIENTDAEGRLTLADAVTYAKKMNAKAIIDVATLTGAAAIGLGRGNISGFSNDEKLMKNVIDAGLETGDSVWELPFGIFGLGSLAWDPWLQIFGMGSGLGFLVVALRLWIFGLGYLAWHLWLWVVGLRSWALNFRFCIE